MSAMQATRVIAFGLSVLMLVGMAQAQDDGTVPDLTDEQALDQRAVPLMRELGIPVEPITPETAQRSAQHAHRLRHSTGDMPDWRAPEGLLVFGPRTRSYADRHQKVTALYFTVWEDLLQRCIKTVSQHVPFDETGLWRDGPDILDMTASHSRGAYFSPDKAFKIVVETGYAEVDQQPPLKCWISTNRFAMVTPETAMEATARFRAWWARAGYEARFSEMTYDEFHHSARTLRDGHRWYGGVTRFGTANGCPIQLEYSEKTWFGDGNFSFWINEVTSGRSGEQLCTLEPTAPASAATPAEPQDAQPPKRTFAIPAGPSIDL